MLKALQSKLSQDYEDNKVAIQSERLKKRKQSIRRMKTINAINDSVGEDDPENQLIHEEYDEDKAK